VRYHFIREKQSEGVIDIVYIPTDHQLADLFTKPIEAHRFNFLRDRIGMASSVAI
jgi:hypothetical protein